MSYQTREVRLSVASPAIYSAVSTFRAEAAHQEQVVDRAAGHPHRRRHGSEPPETLAFVKGNGAGVVPGDEEFELGDTPCAGVIRQRPEQPKEPTPPTKRSGTENPLLMDRE